MYLRSRRDSTTSNEALLNISVISVASLAGLVSAVTFWYFELPMTSATRFSAQADWPARQAANAATTRAASRRIQIPGFRSRKSYHLRVSQQGERPSSVIPVTDRVFADPETQSEGES